MDTKIRILIIIAIILGSIGLYFNIQSRTIRKQIKAPIKRINNTSLQEKY